MPPEERRSRGTPTVHFLEVRELRYLLRLGVSSEERARPQEVSVTVHYRFFAAPAGQFSDDIGGTLCYATLNDALERHFAAREFKLLERVAGETYAVARELARGAAEVAVRVHKLHPPVKNLAGGALFTCGDFSP